MKTKSQREANRALTLVEVLMVLSMVLIVVALVLPAFSHSGHVDMFRIRCVNNLRQIGLSYRTWSLDHDDRFPMQVSTNQGGTLEYSCGPYALAHYAVMSNELGTPKILLCPADLSRTPSTNFGVDLVNAKISYFIGLDTTITNSRMWLGGDRNLQSDSAITNGILFLSTNSQMSWTPELHHYLGNVLLSDGSVQQVSTNGLKALLRSASAVNRLAMP